MIPLLIKTVKVFLIVHYVSAQGNEQATLTSSSSTPFKNADSPPIWASEPVKSHRISEKKCQEYNRGFVPKKHSDLGSSRCDFGAVELVVGGVHVNPGEFPYMAAIGWTSSGSKGAYEFSCGGSLISPYFVLTAGHCSSNPRHSSSKPAVVRLGDKNINSSVSDGANPLEVAIKSIHVHPDYKPPIRYNDIALLELAKKVHIQADIRPACLWTQRGFDGHTTAIATGWGVTDPYTRESSDELQKVSLPLLENNYCDTLLYPYRNRKWGGFSHSQMCAGELKGGKGTCQGDSGAPLQVLSKENQCIFYVMGVLSFGKGCAEIDKPSIFTRVYSYLDWIERIVWPEERKH